MLPELQQAITNYFIAKTMDIYAGWFFGPLLIVGFVYGTIRLIKYMEESH